MPTLHIVAGPNGARESALARSRRFGEVQAIDPDAIAHRISPDDPESASVAAGREAAREQFAGIAGGRTPVVETTLVGKTVFRIMEHAHGPYQC